VSEIVFWQALLLLSPSISEIPFPQLKLVCFPRFDSCAPAYIDLSVCPSMSLAPRSSIVSRQLPLRSPATSRLYRPCRSSHSLHSRSYPRRFTLITRTSHCSRQLPSCVAVYPRDSRSRRVLCLARHSLGGGGSRVPRAPFPSLGNQKKLSCVWIFHDGPGRKTGDIDTLSFVRCIRTRDHAFPAWDRNSIGQTSFYFFYIRG
jgi:hypothetical protein